MKEISLEQSIRRSADVNRRLVLPTGERTQRTWPLCLTCGREVEAAEIKNVNTKGCEIWARCHGKEDFYKVTWKVPVAAVGADILDDVNVGWSIRRAMSDGVFFDPHHIPDFSHLIKPAEKPNPGMIILS